MGKPRILYLVQFPPPVHGASEMNRMVFESEVVNEGFEKRAIPLNFSTELSQLQHFSLAKVFKAFGILFRLFYELIAHRPRVVYFSMIPFGPLLFRDGLYLILIRLWGAVPVIHLHRPGLHHVKPTRCNRFIYRNLFHGCKVVHLSSQLVERELIPLGLNPEDLFSFPNAVDFNPAVPKVRETASNILFFSNLYPHKGFFKLIEAFALIADRFPELTLTIAGHSPYPTIPQRISSLTKSLKLDGRVRYIGGVERSKREEVYRSADIFVLPSESEYFPLVILETMLAGVPVITTGAENIGCYFEDRREVLFIHDIVPTTIAHLMEELINNKQLRIDISQNALLKVRSFQDEVFVGLAAIFRNFR